jgi:hypothetical protein
MENKNPVTAVQLIFLLIQFVIFKIADLSQRLPANFAEGRCCFPSAKLRVMS